MKSSYMKDSNTFRHTIFLRILRASVLCLIVAGTVAATHANFIETYDDGTDVGIWNCSLSVPRIIETSGGNPGAYVQQLFFSTHLSPWLTGPTRFEPGVDDTRLCGGS